MSTTALRSTRLRNLVIAVATCVFAHAPLHAQVTSATTYTIGILGGLAVPTGDLSNNTSSGYTLGITLGMHAPLTPMGFRVEGNFVELPIQNAPSSNKHRIYGIAADALYNLGTPSANGGLYLTGGLGYYGVRDILTDAFGNTFQSDVNWNPGLNAGLGYYLPLSGFAVTFEGRYQHVFSSPSQGVFPITVGITF